jgi:hypothetical protein
MDYSIFDNVIQWIKAQGYSITATTQDDYWFYAKNNESINKSGLEINQKYPNIKFPNTTLDLGSRDFLIVMTEIYKEGDLLQIFVDTDECNFADSSKKMNVYASGYRDCVDINKYYSHTFIDYKLDNLNELIESIAQRKEWVSVKEYSEPDENNLIFVQINLVIGTKLTKYIKQEKSNIFFINNGFLSRHKENKIKAYIDLNSFSKRKQQEIADIINSYYQNLTIIKKPSTREIIFGIKGQEFIKMAWNKYDETFYPVMNEQIKL